MIGDTLSKTVPEMPLTAAVAGVELYAVVDNGDVRVQVAVPNGLATLDENGLLVQSSAGGVEEELLAALEAAQNAATVAEDSATKAQAAAVSAGQGYDPPVAYSPGLDMTLSRQTVSFAGDVYAPRVAHLPFTTSGTFEVLKFRLIQGVTAADIIEDTSGALVGFKQSASGLRPVSRNSVLCLIGDSITTPMSYWQGAESTLFGSGGVFEGWTVYNSAGNGKRLKDYHSSIGGGDQNAAPLHGDDSTTNLWRVVNSNPDEIVVMLGTNDMRKIGIGETYSSLSAAEAGMKSDLKEIVDFLLANTSARLIDLQVPPPFTYISGSATGFANFVDADDAATRNEAMLKVYYSMRNYSSRVAVTDMHKAMFPPGTSSASRRWDSLEASVDPDGTGSVIKVDELHWTPLGERRRAMVMDRCRRPTVPISGVVNKPSVVTFRGAYASVRAFVRGVGPDYFDVYSNTVERALGAINSISADGGPPATVIPRMQDLHMIGFNSALFTVLRGQQLRLIDSSGAAFTITPTNVTHNAVDSLNDYWRISHLGGSLGITLGLVDIYISSPDDLPRVPALHLPVELYIAGAAADARKTLPTSDTKPVFNATTVQATRQNNSGACSIDLYVSNVWNGSYSGSVSGSVPGYRLGKITFAPGYVQSTGWTADAMNFPDGTASLPDNPTYATALYAVVVSGTVGDWASVVIKAR